MAQKFNSLEEAAEQLGISKDRLSQLREAGKVRGYRDGGSWKFRSDDIEKLSADGIPTLDPPPSDIDLGSGLSLGSGSSFDSALGLSNDDPESSGIDLAGADDSMPAPGASDLSLDEIDEPTLPVLAGDDDSEEVLALDPDDDLLNLSDSILLSEKSLGGVGRPPSTIIGKADLDPDLDLTLASSSSKPAGKSDVRLAETSNVLGAAEEDLLELEPLGSGSDNFKGLAEVDVDLEAQSSRILSGSESQQAKDALKGAARAMPAAESSELQLAATSSVTVQPGSDISLDIDSGRGSSLTGLSALELDDDDDQVLGDGSDITLSSASSGINIISPSDSGLSLDDVALSASSMSSPLDLGGGGDDAELEPLELSDDDMAGEEPFQLTPMGEADDDEKDSSQVIALDEMGDEEGAGAMFQPAGSSTELGDDFGTVGLSPGMTPVAVGSTDDVAVSGVVMGMLTLAVVLLLMCGTMMYDLVLNMWSWGGTTSINSYLMDQLSKAL